MTETPAADVVERELNRAIERIMGIEIDAMRGDNLAVTLCSHFEDADDDTEPDDNGWKQSAIDAYDAIKQSIDGLFTPVRDEITRLRAENAELQRKLDEAVSGLRQYASGCVDNGARAKFLLEAIRGEA